MSHLSSTLAYSTDSAGMHPSHTLPLKLQAIAEAGFAAAETSFPDLEAYAEQEHPGSKMLDESGKGDLDMLVQAATKIRKLCSELGLSILAVHPCAQFSTYETTLLIAISSFDQFEGYGNSPKRAAKLERASAWFRVLRVRLP